MPKHSAGAIKISETRITHRKYFLGEDAVVIDVSIAVKCDASELIRATQQKNSEAELAPSSAKLFPIFVVLNCRLEPKPLN